METEKMLTAILDKLDNLNGDIKEIKVDISKINNRIDNLENNLDKFKEETMQQFANVVEILGKENNDAKKMINANTVDIAVLKKAVING